MLNKVLAIVDLHDKANLGPLTENRTEAVTTLFGRYTFIDFMLSNFTNSEIDNIAILVSEKTKGIRKHINRDSVYLKNSKTGFLRILSNEKGRLTPIFNTDINNLKENDYVLYDDTSEYVIVAPVSFVANIDFNDIIEKHKESGSFASLVYKETSDDEQFSDCEKVVVDAIGNAQRFDRVSKENGNFNVNLGIYVINKPFFMKLINESSNVSETYSIAQMIKYYTRFDLKLNCIEFKGDVLCFNSLKKYFKNSMDLLDGHLDKILLREHGSIYTTTHNSRPTLYGPKADVKCSLIANGSTINGTVKHSILARDVVVEEGAIVENSILFSHTIVRSGVHIKNVVSNKRVDFKEEKEVIGEENNPIYISQGTNI